MNTSDYTSVNFLIVDDDDVSIMGMKRAMKKLNLLNPTYVAKDGLEALKILNEKIEIDEKKLPPFIVTLDLSMPRMDGFEFLNTIRNDSVYQKLVVFVLTTSDAPNDVAAAYRKNIAGYIVKENAEETFSNALKMLRDYGNLVVLPN